MGCDIHGFIEKKKSAPNWRHVCEVGIDRNYEFFGVLNNIRRDRSIFPGRGFPEDASPTVKEAYEDWSGDAHSASWISKEEILSAMSNKEVEDVHYNFEKILDLMDECEEETRFVFWFDN